MAYLFFFNISFRFQFRDCEGNTLQLYCVPKVFGLCFFWKKGFFFFFFLTKREGGGGGGLYFVNFQMTGVWCAFVIPKTQKMSLNLWGGGHGVANKAKDQDFFCKKWPITRSF
jgi:hypothetical protein